MPKFSPEELLGTTFLKQVDDQCIRAEVVKKLQDDDANNHQNIKFLVHVGDDRDEIMGYAELCNIIEEQNKQEMEDPDRAWIYKEVTNHQGPLKPHDPRYKGSKWNMKILWEDNSQTWEPLTIIKKYDAVTVATYAEKNGLLNKDGWKSLKRIVKNRKVHQQMINQAKLKSKRYAPVYQFGVRIPLNPKEAVQLDEANGNKKWQEAMDKELDLLHEYNTFKDLGKRTSPLTDFKKICVHFVYACKHDLRRRARLVAGGHLTPSVAHEAYSGVVSLQSLRIAIFLGELNGLKLGVGDVGSAYLEAVTNEKVYIIAGPEFGDLAGHTLVIYKALYGLRTSGARYNEKFAKTMRSMGFKPCKSDPDVWMRNADDCYEYVCVYVDDLMAILKDPNAFFKSLVEEHNYKLKGVGPPEYHLGGNFYHDADGTLAWGAKTYVKKLLKNYQIMFGELPKEWSAPLDKNDHPEIDDSYLLNEIDTKKYQSLIGALNWAITIGRFDIQPSVVSLSTFRVAPRAGHLERLKRICGYLRKHPDGAIRFRTNIPDHESRYEIPDFSWLESVYGEVNERLDPDMPVPKGKYVRLTTNLDANLMHCLVTGRSLTGVLHFLNQTPIEWFSKKQNTVETATYGSEFNAARTATEQSTGIRYKLHDFGAPIDGPTWMFGDNESVIKSSTIPQSVLKKHHNALSYHCVCKACAAHIINFIHIPGTENVANVLTKFLPWSILKELVGPILFWKGETIKKNNAAIEGSDKST